MVSEMEIVGINQSATSTFPVPTCTAQDGTVFHGILMSHDRVSTEGRAPLRPIPLAEFLSFELSLVKEVEAVFTTRHNNLFYLWVVVDQFDRKVREKIYERERAIIEEFKELEFDFNIVSRRGRDLRDVISDPVMTLTFQRAS